MLLWGESKEAKKVESENESAKDPLKCDSIHISNSSLCSSENHNEKKAANVAPDTSSILHNTLG